MKYAKHIGFASKDEYEYFQPDVNAHLVSNTIKTIDPDFLFLQEFWNPSDADTIEQLKEYPYRQFLDMWYRKSGACIASKKPFSIEIIDGFSIVHYENLNIIPIHLNSFSPLKRLEETTILNKISKSLSEKTIILGDTNIWSRKNFYLFSKDIQSYAKLCKSYSDVSAPIIATNFLGFKLDKVFTSKDIIIEKIESPRIRGDYMDHYPIFFDIQ